MVECHSQGNMGSCTIIYLTFHVDYIVIYFAVNFYYCYFLKLHSLCIICFIQSSCDKV